MATISVSNVSDGETIDASDLNNPINTIVNEVNGNLDNNNIASNAAIAQSKIAFTDWQDWTPSYTNLTVGNGTVVAKYCQIGKTVHYRLVFTFGSTSAFTGAISFSPPVTAVSYGNTSSGSPVVGWARLENNSSTNYAGSVQLNSSGNLQPLHQSTSYSTVSSTSPFTWGVGDEVIIAGTYEAA